MPVPMSLLRIPSLLAVALAGAIASPWLQDPVKPPPAPVPAPAPAAAEEAPEKAVPGKPARHALEGVYVLKRRMSPAGQEARQSRGYLAITSRHMFLCLAAEGAAADKPLLHAGVRSWQPHQERMRTAVLIGWLTDKDGRVQLEKPGHEELRRVEPIQGGVRVMQPDDRWLEFERVE